MLTTHRNGLSHNVVWNLNLVLKILKDVTNITFSDSVLFRIVELQHRFNLKDINYILVITVQLCLRKNPFFDSIEFI